MFTLIWVKKGRQIKYPVDRETSCVTLWRPHTTQFHAPGLQAEAENNPIVLLFVGLTVRLYEGQLSLQGSTICKWYGNANIPEVLALQNRSMQHKLAFFAFLFFYVSSNSYYFTESQTTTDSKNVLILYMQHSDSKNVLIIYINSQ